jgi:hypothetical protein
MPGPGSRSKRCGMCAGCQSQNCGTCRFCLNMRQFGGPGTLKQPCMQRKCIGAPEAHYFGDMGMMDQHCVPIHGGGGGGSNADDPAGDASSGGDGTAGSTAANGGGAGSRKTRCGMCAGCIGDNCGTCRFCLNMKQFGGPGTLKQPCTQRKW